MSNIKNCRITVSTELVFEMDMDKLPAGKTVEEVVDDLVSEIYTETPSITHKVVLQEVVVKTKGWVYDAKTLKYRKVSDDIYCE